MRKIIWIVIIAAVAFGLYQLGRHKTPQSANGAPRGSVGAVAAPFSLKDIDGKPIELASYHGKVVLVDFWATWCVPCQAEIPHFVDFQNKFGSQGYQTVGISMDDGPEPVRGFYQKYNMNYPVVMGTEDVAKSYGGVLGLPVTFLIARDGKIAAKYVGETETEKIQQKLEELLKQ
jgi:cytochrome c biogenesis protein CcmG, thiol:disulfide interchange protein DsbE